MIILDTNVISEIIKPTPNRNVEAWVSSVHPQLLFVTAITQAELLYGLELLPDGKRKQDLGTVISAFFDRSLANPVLAFADSNTMAYAQISAHRRRIGRLVRELDAQIAAIAATRGFAVATRNVRDFDDCGIKIVNPWEFDAK